MRDFNLVVIGYSGNSKGQSSWKMKMVPVFKSNDCLNGFLFKWSVMTMNWELCKRKAIYVILILMKVCLICNY